MKLTGLIVFFFFFVGVTTAQDCKKFKTGKFVVRSTKGPTRVTKIKRTKNKQIERGEGVVSKNRVVWIDECTYTIVDIKTRDKRNIVGDETVICKIIEVGDDYYIVEATIEKFKYSANIRVEVDD
jgi:hypothetical protein